MKNQKGRIIGIDYSMNSPAICTHDRNKPWDVSNCSFGFLSTKKKLEGSFLSGKVVGKRVRDYSTDIERFVNNAIDLKSFIGNVTLDDLIAVEGYAFGARGMRIFQVGECTGILNLMFIQSNGKIINGGKNISRPSPGQIKKYATGAGNAIKQKMLESFQNETGIDMIEALFMKKLNNPVDDLVDSYWICKHLYHQSQEN